MEDNQENILINLDMKNTAVRNNGGGFYNHNLFWNVMTLMEADQQEILTAIESAFGTFEEFKAKFSSRSNTIWFRLGLALCSQGGKLDVCGTPNQDNPLMPG
jgi:Fe-Mn family superoxide dismutase